MPVDFIELSKGPVVVIDDEIYEKDHKENGGYYINRIISKIEEKGLPVLKYDTIDKVDNEIGNICFLNFIILDWRLYPEETPVGVSIGDELKDHLNKKKVAFINKVKSICFSPIFIFTDISTEGTEEEIEKPLMENNLLYSDNGKNFIFIRNKQEILKNLFDEVNDWIVKNSHIYFSKIWLNQFLKNSNEIFWSLYEKNSNWPNVFYKSFEEDGEDPVSGLNDILFRLIKAKISYSDFDTSIIEKQVAEPDIDEIKSLYESIMYLKKNIIDDIKPGDIFRNREKYYINIRPECDTTRRKGENTRVYLIKGDRISKEKMLEEGFYDRRLGIIIPKETQAILFRLDSNDFVRFKFDKFEMQTYSSMKNKKICRLLPPFITGFQHQFSSFLGRYGIPRVPKEVFDEIFKEDKGNIKDENNV